MMVLILLGLVVWVGGSMLFAPVVGRVLGRSGQAWLADQRPAADLVASGRWTR